MEQLTYIQSMKALFAAPGGYNPIQSAELGEAIPDHVAVSAPPGPIDVGLAVRAVLLVTVKSLLAARTL